jgi:hypothetical protein
LAKTSVDELLATIAAVRVLQDVVRKQEEAISIILDRLDALERGAAVPIGGMETK